MSHFLPLKRHHLLAITTASCLGLASSATAAVAVTNITNVAPTGGAPGSAHDPATSGSPLVAASTTDLVQGMTAMVTYNRPSTGGSDPTTTNENSTGAGAWTDGSLVTAYGTGGGDSSHTAYGTVDGRTGAWTLQTLVTFDLGGFYDISQVNVILGWNDSGRDDSSFSLYTSADNVTFDLVAAYAKPADNTGAITTPVTNLHSVADDGGSDIATGVRYIQVVFTDADNGFAGLAEIDVFGSAVPEPSSILLLGLGSLAALTRRRRA